MSGIIPLSKTESKAEKKIMLQLQFNDLVKLVKILEMQNLLCLECFYKWRGGTA